MPTIKILNEFGHETFEGLTVEEAEKIIEEKKMEDKYFVVDQNTKKILREIELTEDQEVILVPIVAGG